ncbi:FliO/MopB family protein [Proteiniclasticum sp. SCR006]|uniref:FliO/MopB family protein n=1 Tax=Proteiniclasticum aestuarii TaxID=2817862 RepID=A0A939H714_9CLOT|nr:flagellar biosynthetic protein FliO [Proteiniclasticum aestuarii]MBO1265374.1 FliO/MopB family protein [Proteiniclasticum aestuarii]
MDLKLIFSLIQTFLALAFVLGLAYVVLRFGKKVTNGNTTYVRIIEKTMLTNQSFLAVIKVGEDYHLASVTSGEVKILKDLNKEEIEEVLEEKQRKLEENPLANLWKMRKDSE